MHDRDYSRRGLRRCGPADSGVREQVLLRRDRIKLFRSPFYMMPLLSSVPAVVNSRCDSFSLSTQTERIGVIGSRC